MDNYQLIIIGGGPAGVAAGIYAARKKIKTILITESFGGQSVVAKEIDNFIGFPSLPGYKLALIFENHLRKYEGDYLKILTNDRVVKIEDKLKAYKVITEKGEEFSSLTILVATGSKRKKLKVKGEKEFEGKGVAYCSTCDAPIFKDKKVAVVGGGNAGLEAVRDLIPYAKEIYLMEFSDKVKGDPITFELIKKENKVKVLTEVEVVEILGKNLVEAVNYKNRKTGKIESIRIDGIFIEIGLEPNSEMVKELVETNEKGEIIIDPVSQKTSKEGIWAAGDITNSLVKQINVCIGDGIKALLDIYQYLNKKG